MALMMTKNFDESPHQPRLSTLFVSGHFRKNDFLVLFNTSNFL